MASSWRGVFRCRVPGSLNLNLFLYIVAKYES